MELPVSRGKKPVTNLIGRRFAMLEVVSYAGFAGRSHRWNVKCDCGGASVVAGSAFTSGNTKSCGCQKGAGGRKSLTTHGLTATRAHGIWKAAKSRCFNPNASNYRHYGGRGITMCDRWRESFQAFYDEMGECPPGLSLERIDANGDYGPGNCRWATQAEQVRNTGRNRLIEHEGKMLVAKDYCEAVGISYPAFLRRLGPAAPKTQPRAPAST